MSKVVYELTKNHREDDEAEEVQVELCVLL